VLRMTSVLRMTWREYCSVDLHAAGIDHWDDEAVWGSFAALRMTIALRMIEGLCYQGVKCADCDEWLLGTEA
jgi:hypothetical protein